MLGAALVTCWALFRGHRFPRLSDKRWLWYAALGFIGMVAPFYLFSRGQKVIDSGLAGITAGTMPLITIVLAHFFANERLNSQKFIGFMVGFFGLIILFLPDEISLTLISDWRSQGLLVGGAFCYALTTIVAKRAPDTSPAIGAAMMVTCAALMALIAALFSGPMPSLTLHSFAMVCGLGAGSTGIATILYLFVVQKTGPSMLAKINYFPPVVSVSAGVLLLGEDFSPRIAVAFAVIVAGLLIARSKGFKKSPVATLPPTGL